MDGTQKQVGKMKWKYSKREKREHLQGFLFVSPAVMVSAIFIGLAVLFIIYLSFNKVNLFKHTYNFVGADNFLRAFRDKTTRIAFKNTLVFSAIVVPTQTFLALVIASVLNSKIKGKIAFRAIYFLPTLTSSSALTLIFMFMFSINGPINSLLMSMGIIDAGINYLDEPSFALKVIMAMNIWSTIPLYMTLYLASLQDLPGSIYESAEIDGASAVKRFYYITMPYLKPMTTYVLLTGIIGTLQMFDQAYIFSNGSGGPANATMTVSLLVYRYAFGTQNAMGFAATLAIMLAIVILLLSLLSQRINKSESWY
jgi:multiple sugar transport system permease protein/raffinose/stachyose/melibiose transport system permease protein